MKRVGNFLDLSGDRFGRLTVVKVSYKKHRKYHWLCKCDCGNTTIVAGTSLRNGQTKGCGCTRGKNRLKHGGFGTQLYSTWANMLQRTTNEKRQDYNRYGGRGITVCDEWRQYENFRDWSISNGYNDDLTIDRINVNGNYEPNNCRWVTVDVQANNKRNNILIEYNGEERTLAEWAKTTEIRYCTLLYRIRSGWSVDTAFNRPTRRFKSGKRNKL